MIITEEAEMRNDRGGGQEWYQILRRRRDSIETATAEIW